MFNCNNFFLLGHRRLFWVVLFIISLRQERHKELVSAQDSISEYMGQESWKIYSSLHHVFLLVVFGSFERFGCGYDHIWISLGQVVLEHIKVFISAANLTLNDWDLNLKREPVLFTEKSTALLHKTICHQKFDYCSLNPRQSGRCELLGLHRLFQKDVESTTRLLVIRDRFLHGFHFDTWGGSSSYTRNVSGLWFLCGCVNHSGLGIGCLAECYLWLRCEEVCLSSLKTWLIRRRLLLLRLL